MGHHEHEIAAGEGYAAAVVTVSDRASQGIYEDATGPAVVALLVEQGYHVVRQTVVPDERACIEDELRACIREDIALVLTCGGTGFSPRDVTPEATAAVCERMAPGLGEAMRSASMRITDRACLSRATAGLAARTLIVNLPGSPKAAVENIEAVISPISHGLEVLRGGTVSCGAGGVPTAGSGVRHGA